MSLTLSEPRAARFHDRFEHVRRSLRRSQVGVGVFRTVLAAASGLLLMMAADWALELPWAVRAVGLGLTAAAAVAIFIGNVVLPWRWWSQPRTAAEIEYRFPELGQRIRTVIQFSQRPDEALDAEGVAAGLVAALEEETENRTRPLPLGTVVQRRRVAAAAALGAVPVVAIALLALSGREWRLAFGRALLGEAAYTTLEVTPGDVRVDQGERLRFSVRLTGRPRRDVVLETRPSSRAGAAATTIPMKPKGGDPSATAREAELARVLEPVTYRVVAGPASSPTYRVDVRYPLAIKAFDIALVPPAYTAVAPSVVKGGDFQAIEGTAATFRVRFDSPPADATLVLIDPTARAKRDEPAPRPLRIPLKAENATHTATMTLARGGLYRIEAKSADGRALPEKRYRIDVQEDRPPRVIFERPDEALEVHPIAEVLHRVRVGDDFGLTRAGIIVRFNDGEEETLTARDFAPDANGKPTVGAVLAETLLLEKFHATSTDAVTYFAFAEDNYPSGARRTESELRFIDIRPFKREYRAPDGMGGDDNGGESTTLNELIARQRFNLNRTMRLAHRRASDRTPPEDPIRIATFEESLAGLVREFTEGLEGIAGQRVEPLHQAEEAMLAAVDALDRGESGRAPNLMAEAVRRLIETRQSFRIFIGEAGADARRRAQRFDRTQTQKIRRPKSKNEEADAVAAELEEIAKEEDLVYATLNGLMMDGGPPTPGATPASAGGDPEDKPAEAPKPRDDVKPAPGSVSGDRDGKAAEASKTRAEVRERQEDIADRARSLEERLKRIEEVSELAKSRMAKAAEAAEKAAGALGRGSTREAVAPTRAGALMLHEVARQVRGEVADEVADELAMARDLAEDLARREDEFADGKPSSSNSGSKGKGMDPGQGKGEDKGQGQGQRQGEREGNGNGNDNGNGKSRDQEENERLDQLEEAARTLEEWLKGASASAEGNAGERVRELLQQGRVTEIVTRAGRVGALYRENQRDESRQEARALARVLETLARRLDQLHRGIVAPELAKLAELERRGAELAERMKELKTEAEIAEWKRLAGALARDLEAAGFDDAAVALNRALADTGRWDYTPGGIAIVPDRYLGAMRTVVARIQERMQDLVLKDLTADRDEATPPEFRALVERYYKVLSSGMRQDAK